MEKAIASAILVGLVLFALVADRRVAQRRYPPRWFTSPILSSVLVSACVSAVFVVIALEINLLVVEPWLWIIEVDLPMVAAAGLLAALAARLLVSKRGRHDDTDSGAAIPGAPGPHAS